VLLRSYSENLGGFCRPLPCIRPEGMYGIISSYPLDKDSNTLEIP